MRKFRINGKMVTENEVKDSPELQAKIAAAGINLFDGTITINGNDEVEEQIDNHTNMMESYTQEAKRKTDRNIFQYIILSILTLGIYGVWYIYDTIRDVDSYSEDGADMHSQYLNIIIFSIVLMFFLFIAIGASDLGEATGLFSLLARYGIAIFMDTWFVELNRQINELADKYDLDVHLTSIYEQFLGLIPLVGWLFSLLYLNDLIKTVNEINKSNGASLQK